MVFSISLSTYKISQMDSVLPDECSYIDIDTFVNCSWVDTRWQQYSTHLHTNNTQNDKKQTIHRTTQKTIHRTTQKCNWNSADRAPSWRVRTFHSVYLRLIVIFSSYLWLCFARGLWSYCTHERVCYHVCMSSDANMDTRVRNCQLPDVRQNRYVLVIIGVG
jgi:hypothetical protein